MVLSSQDPPFFSELWLIPGADAAKSEDAKGVYAISEGGKHAFDLALNADRSARKSHAPATLGRWQGTGDLILVAWTDGWRDLLVRDGAGFKKLAFRPGSSLAGEPTNNGIAARKQ
jgi:hypothetical protein